MFYGLICFYSTSPLMMMDESEDHFDGQAASPPPPMFGVSGEWPLNQNNVVASSIFMPQFDEEEIPEVGAPIAKNPTK
jgi:hypothetical protein